ncbi:subclass B3 metallo-beta-lactamase [Sphingomonas sp. Leaf4]|uniref:subclass B3 metallo-beta-lactamase n=1 Tax=Sphingomonas sp. Leaf4 TaxID=2876553 RepID=UPI001E5BB7DD|nr:subclass B3 metallo-beta-lactamase [Sphingomonas sp. Leaf4]
MIRALLLVLALLGAAPAWAQGAPADVRERQRVCAGKDGWSDPAPPVRIYGNTYDVGTCGITVLLLTGPAGHVVIDAATAQAVPSILANITRLGFRPRDVKLLLMSHSHVDHAGGLAALQRATGARLMASAAARAVLTSGKAAVDDPQATILTPVARVPVAGTVDDGQTLSVGPVRILAHSTPGHAPDGMSWSWTSCEGGKCYRMVFADSLSAVSADTYRFIDHPDYVARLRGSIGRVAALKCDILLTPHPGASYMGERLANRGMLADPRGCTNYAAEAMVRLESRLLREAKPAEGRTPIAGPTEPFCPDPKTPLPIVAAVLSPGIKFRVEPSPREVVERGIHYAFDAHSPLWARFGKALCDPDRWLPVGTPRGRYAEVVIFPKDQPEGPYVTLTYPSSEDPMAPVQATLNGRPMLLPQPLVRWMLDSIVTMRPIPGTGHY